MKRIGAVLFIVAFSIFFVLPAVQAAETLKIGIFDLQKVIKESKTVESYRQKLGKDADAKKKLFSDKQNAVRQTDEKLKKDAAKLKPNERKTLEDKLQAETKELQRLKEDIELQLKKADRELTDKVLRDINAIIQQIYEKENYSIIFEKSAAGVINFRNTLDITDKVIKAYDTK